jgi:hypothetical protein
MMCIQTSIYVISLHENERERKDVLLEIIGSVRVIIMQKSAVLEDIYYRHQGYLWRYPCKKNLYCIKDK